MSKPEPITSGTPVPAFRYISADGTEHSTDELKGKTYLVYFYPRDDTPGCTKEACAFRDAFGELTEAGITIIGVSADDDVSHDKFRKKYDLPFPLAADTDKAIVNAFGVWGEKKFMGKTYDGIHRMSFLVGPDSLVLKTYLKVKPEQHAAEILADAKELVQPI